jgi:adenine deaminase
MQTSSLAKVTKQLVSTAIGRRKADLVIKKVNLINVYTGELIEDIDVATKGDRIALIGKADKLIGTSTRVIKGKGKYLSPGFLDGHVHLDDSMVTVTEFAKAVLSLGTTGVFMDPHEIANVLGLKGVKLIVREARKLPLRVWMTIPSCVPSLSPEFDTSGAKIGLKEVEEALGWKEVVALGEVMNYLGVLQCNKEIHQKIQATLNKGKVVEGHAAGLLDSELGAYASAGITSCHESISKLDGLQRARLGIYTMIREGYAPIKNLAEVIKIVTEEKVDSRRICLVTDDRHPADILEEGHMNWVVKRAIDEGVGPIRAIQMATLNPAEHYKVDGDVGGIAPSKLADLLLLDNLQKISVNQVIVGSKLVAKEGKILLDFGHPTYPRYARETVKVKRPLTPNDFRVKAPSKEKHLKVHVIGVAEREVITKKLIEEIPVKRGFIEANPKKDITKIAIIERHKLTGNLGLGFVKGFGFKKGATASTIAHDSHNLLVIGLNDEDMAFAANRLIETQGGIIVVNKHKVLGLVELPIAGLMSEKSMGEVYKETKQLERAWKGIGCRMASPFPTLILLSLPVLPALRITNKGLIDTMKFKKLNLIVQ